MVLDRVALSQFGFGSILFGFSRIGSGIKWVGSILVGLILGENNTGAG